MATNRSVLTRPVALMGLLILAIVPGIASATPCGPEEGPTMAPSSAPSWKIEMETVEETDGTWYKVRVERGDKTTVLAGMLPGDDMDAEAWGIQKSKSPLSKLGGAAVMSWMNEKMKSEVEFAGWAREKAPVSGGKGRGEGAVPEPTAALLFGAGFALTSLRRRATA